jgi:hypothetical protein
MIIISEPGLYNLSNPPRHSRGHGPDFPSAARRSASPVRTTCRAQYGFVKDRDFTTQEVLDGRNWRTDYQGTLSMGKELAMVENNDRDRMIRRCDK